MDRQVARQTNSYRQGLVLGLTMAEIILLLVFCLLIAMATFLRKEQTRIEDFQKQLQDAQSRAGSDREFIEALKKNRELYERLSKDTASGDNGAIDEFWRELVDSHSVTSSLRKEGLSLSEIRDRASEGKKLKEKGIDLNRAIRDSDIVGSVGKVLSQATDPSKSPQEIADAIKKSMTGGSSQGHKWPPMIKLSEAEGYSFESGSAELSPKLRLELIGNTPQKISDLMKLYDVNVIEVVGHTDEQPLGSRQSNLDRSLLTVLNSNTGVTGLSPADNAGLGLARAVSVVSVLRSNANLARYSIIPLSGAQLVNTDERLATGDMPGDVPQRRRIEIRLRKSDRNEVSIEATRPADAAIPKPRPKRPAQKSTPARANPFPAPL